MDKVTNLLDKRVKEVLGETLEIQELDSSTLFIDNKSINRLLI